MPKFKTLSDAAVHCKKVGCPFSWIKKSGDGYHVTRPAKKKAKKRTTKKRRTKKRATKKRTTRKKATKKRATKKRATKKRTTKKKTTKKKTTKRAKPGAWGASIKGTTKRAKFFRKQKASGASKKQAAARWKFSKG